MTLEGCHSPEDPTQTRCFQVAAITVPEHKKAATPHLKRKPVAYVNTLANCYFFSNLSTKNHVHIDIAIILGQFDLEARDYPPNYCY